MLPFLMPPVLTKLSSLPVPSVVSHLTALAELRSGAASVFLLLLAATADSDILYPQLWQYQVWYNDVPKIKS